MNLTTKHSSGGVCRDQKKSSSPLSGIQCPRSKLYPKRLSGFLSRNTIDSEPGMTCSDSSDDEETEEVLLGHTPKLQEPSGFRRKSRAPHKMANEWIVIFFLISLFCPVSYLTWAISGNNLYSGFGQAASPVAGVCLLMVFCSSPANASQTKYLALYTYPYIIIVFASAIYGELKSELTRNAWITSYSCWSVFILILLTFAFRVRSKLASRMTRKEMRHYVNEVVFLKGISCLAPMVYLTTESIQVSFVSD